MDEAAATYNRHGDFDTHITVRYDPYVSTAHANFDGELTFGGSRSSRVALHEIAHTLGVGTQPKWNEMLQNGTWTGNHANHKLEEFDGQDAKINGDKWHFWPYGLNYGSASSTERRRHVELVQALRRDMGLHGRGDDGTVLENEVYELRAVHSGKVLEVSGGGDTSNGATVHQWQSYERKHQRWRLKHTGGGWYKLVATHSGKVLEVGGGDWWNGANVRQWDDSGHDHQRWYVQPYY
jgi:hypothetical protein